MVCRAFFEHNSRIVNEYKLFGDSLVWKLPFWDLPIWPLTSEGEIDFSLIEWML